MAKKELRLAVVIYGGASLAIYMHGVTKELLKLVRASKVLHEMGLENARDASYHNGGDDRAADTEAIYFELLKQINRTSVFRVVVDVVAGASAGAINGVMLAKAIVDDALIDSHTDLWLGKADADQLSAEDIPRWRKWYLHPFLMGLSYWLPEKIVKTQETRDKLTRLIRASWLRPPFSGERLCHHFLDALDTMTKTRRKGSSLLPHDQRIDVYASLTDLVGYPRTIRLNDELIAREQGHGAYCRLSHLETEAGRAQSDFVDDNNPGLVWAARASSSYAGAFPPFNHEEITRVLAARNQRWQGEARFLRDSLYGNDGTPAHRLFDPSRRAFVDGGIVNNKPFAVALEALNHRSADRQVERCIVYIEPDPNVSTLR